MTTATRTRDVEIAENFREAATHLRRPFTPEAVKFKVQATYPKDKPTGALIVAYIDARLVVERLNLIVPHLWYDEYVPAGNGLLMCKLTVDGITRSDVGEGVGKGLHSDALKRAAVKFGIGVSLYAVPQSHLKLADGTVKEQRTAKGPTLVMTPAGENRVRTIYKMWLDSHGADAFGEPLSHGDVEGAQGDVEADVPEVAIADPVPPLGPKRTQEIASSASAACVKLAGGQEQGRTLWTLIQQDCGGYMPQAAALALVRAATPPTQSVEAPDPT